MQELADNVKRWRDAAEVDWFSQFIKAWIPFNAWMTHSFGDLSDRDLIDRVKAGNNTVYNRIVPMLSRQLRAARDIGSSWQDETIEATDFRLQVGELHKLLQTCLVQGRKGRVSFETVDVGSNPHKDEQQVRRKRSFRVRRDYPARHDVTLELSATSTNQAFMLTLNGYNRRTLEDILQFQALHVEVRTTLIAMFESVNPRRITSVLAGADTRGSLCYGDCHFIADPNKNFSALVDIIYNLRNALFHGSITPNETNNAIYKPAYSIVMRFVRSTI